MKTPSVLTVLFLAACGGSPPPTMAAEPVTQAEVAPAILGEATLPAVLAGTHRSDEHRARDQFRHPAETLAFMGLEPAMSVVEVWPGGGWYTEVLAPYLRDGGLLIAAGYDPNDEGRRGGYERTFREKLAERPEIYDRVQNVVFTPEDMMTDVDDGSADLVLVFRAVHNMMRAEGGAAQYFVHMSRVLKPGGVLGIVQHRMPEGAGPPNDGTAGYLTEALVIELAEAAGFVLEERSELNANPNDTHVHAEGVWSMPPSLRGGDESLRGLGESDRMTLRFRKPAAVEVAGMFSPEMEERVLNQLNADPEFQRQLAVQEQ